MQAPKLFYIFSLLLLFFGSCQNNTPPYAIRDFSKKLQPFLIKAVSHGIVDGDSAITYMATDKELDHLSKSDQPILRALALYEMLQRSSYNHFEVIMNHLDDTALVQVYQGEFGIEPMAVSDYLVEEGKWKTAADRLKTVEKLVTEHNYLRAAYYGLSRLKPQEKFYPYIKRMIEKDRPFVETEYGLYALAEFKKPSDIPFIKNILLNNLVYLHERSFDLMKKFPDTAYMDVYEAYYPRKFQKAICIFNNQEAAPSFIKSVAAYKNERSAAILADLLEKKPLVYCNTNTEELEANIKYAIWDNPCPAYSKLRKQVESYILDVKKHSTILPDIYDSSYFSNKPDPEPFSWYQRDN